MNFFLDSTDEQLIEFFNAIQHIYSSKVTFKSHEGTLVPVLPPNLPRKVAGHDAYFKVIRNEAARYIAKDPEMLFKSTWPETLLRVHAFQSVFAHSKARDKAHSPSPSYRCHAMHALASYLIDLRAIYKKMPETLAQLFNEKGQ